MKVACAIQAFLLMAIVASAEAQAQIALPSLTVQNGGRAEELELRSVSVDVRLEGWMAETVLELEFFNHTRRRQEGEFVLKLPDDATVSTYALDIQGHMRPGVSVEKEKARNAYESIKRRQVDPGLVEREAGNIYRTRIFPIEPNKPKRVRIGFIHPLNDAGEYVLPLRHGKKLKNFTCKVSGAHEAPRLSSQGLDDDPSLAGFNSWEWEAQNVQLSGTLRAVSKFPQADEPPRMLLHSQPDGGAHFLVQGRLSQEGDGDGGDDRRWKKVRVLWDTSLSGGWRDHEAEYKALQRIWQFIDDGEVHLQLVGLKLGGPKVYPIRDGESPLIEKALRKVDYDGAADFSLIEPWDDGVTVLVSDGRISAPMWDLDDALGHGDLFLLDSAGRAVGDSAQLSKVAQRLVLGDEGWLEQLTASTAAPRVSNLGREEYDVSVSKGSFAVSGRLPKGFRDKVKIGVPGGSDITVDLTKAEVDEQANDEWTFARRIWAQRRLASLEDRGSRQQIAEFAETERLVSDFTSLIVLELMADHVRYRIPPPEPELLEEYEEKIGDFQLTRTQGATNAWDNKIAWHRTEFPWIDADLSSEVSTVAIWVKSARIAFPKEKLNERELKPYDKWLEEARQLVAERDSLGSSFDYHAWVAKLEEKLTELNALRDQPTAKKADRASHVSVRGFVMDRGIFSAGKGEALMLREVIERAGGPNMFGSWTRVFVYRDARRTGYNMESRLFKDLPLNWGDMVVVESVPWDYYDHWGGADPFMDASSLSLRDGGSSASLRSGGAAPVFEEPGGKLSARQSARSVRSPRRSGVDPFAPADPFAAGDVDDVVVVVEAPGLAGQVIGDDDLKVPDGIDEEIIDALRKHADPHKHYLKLLRGEFGKSRPSSATVIEIARLLFERKQSLLGERMLTNLMEVQRNPVEATRSYAYWLAEFGRNERAAGVLSALAKSLDDADATTRSLVYYDAGQVSADAKFHQLAVEADLGGSGELSELLIVALTDHFGLGGKSQGLLRPFRTKTLPSDVRVVITWAGGEAVPAVEEPDLLADDIDHGAWIIPSDRVYEYQMRRALPGKYQAKIRRNIGRNEKLGDPLTVRIDYYLDWGGDRQQRKTVTRLMETRQLDLPGLEFVWPDSK